MVTDIGYTYAALTSEEISSLASTLNCLGDRSLFANADGTFTIVANEPFIETPKEELARLKTYLASTDYQVIKCYDKGLIYATEYPEEAIKRQQARDRINELQNIIGK